MDVFLTDAQNYFYFPSGRSAVVVIVRGGVARSENYDRAKLLQLQNEYEDKIHIWDLRVEQIGVGGAVAEMVAALSRVPNVKPQKRGGWFVGGRLWRMFRRFR